MDMKIFVEQIKDIFNNVSEIKAMEILGEIIEENPDVSIARRLLARFKIDSYDGYREAIELLNEVLEITPNDIGALLFLGEIWAEEFSDYNRGLEYVNKVLEIDPNNKCAIARKEHYSEYMNCFDPEDYF